jgi:hypothetical protein
VVLESERQRVPDYINARDQKEKLLFSQAEEWFLKESSVHYFPAIGL